MISHELMIAVRATPISSPLALMAEDICTLRGKMPHTYEPNPFGLSNVQLIIAELMITHQALPR